MPAPALSPSAVNGHHHHRSSAISSRVPEKSRRGRGRLSAMAASPRAGGGAGVDGAAPAPAPAAAAVPSPQPLPYAEPLAADARVVVKDASLGVSARVLGERLAHRRYLATFDRLVRFTRPGPAPHSGGSSSAAAAAAAADPRAAAAAREQNGQQQQQEQGQGQVEEHHHDVAYDVIGHPRCEFRFAVVFPYHPPPSLHRGGSRGGQKQGQNADQQQQQQQNDNDEDEGDVTLVREYAHGPHRFVFTLPSGQFERGKHGAGGLLATARAELEEEALLEGGEWHPLLPEGHPGIPEVKWCANAFEPFLCVGPVPHPAPAARDGEEEAAGIEAVRVPLREFRRLAASGEMLLPSVATGWMAIERLKEMGLVRR